jgi:hypothetical protein
MFLHSGRWERKNSLKSRHQYFYHHSTSSLILYNKVIKSKCNLSDYSYFQNAFFANFHTWFRYLFIGVINLFFKLITLATKFIHLRPSWEAVSHAAINNFPAFYGTRRFITVFTRALHWSLSWASSIQSTLPHLIPVRSILILSTHLRLGLPSGFFLLGFPTNILYSFLFSPFVPQALPLSFSSNSSF